MKPPTVKERKHMDRIAQLGCLVCGAQATIHHCTAHGDRMGRLTRSHRLIVPLCPMHHQAVHDPLASDPVSVEQLGHRGFFDKHNIDLLEEAKILEMESIMEGVL